MKQIEIGKNEAGQRLDKLLHKYLQVAGNGFIYKMLRKKNIVLNKKRADGTEILSEGDMVTLFLADETINKFQKEITMPTEIQMPEIIFENDSFLICNKPIGLLTQKSSKDDVSLVDISISYLLNKKEISAENLKSFRPGICNRLDRNTSGVVLIGKTLKALQLCNSLIAERKIQKYYLAVVEGNMEKRFHQTAYLIKNKDNTVTICEEAQKDSKKIETSYIPIAYKSTYTILKVCLHTGRAHQIRAHLAYLGYPVVGDRKYNNKKSAHMYKNQLLHAYMMVFPKDDLLGELSEKTIKAPVPEVFNNYIDYMDLQRF